MSVSAGHSAFVHVSFTDQENGSKLLSLFENIRFKNEQSHTMRTCHTHRHSRLSFQSTSCSTFQVNWVLLKERKKVFFHHWFNKFCLFHLIRIRIKMYLNFLCVSVYWFASNKKKTMHPTPFPFHSNKQKTPSYAIFLKIKKACCRYCCCCFNSVQLLVKGKQCGLTWISFGLSYWRFGTKHPSFRWKFNFY